MPNLHDFPMLVLAFAVPFICIGTLTVQPRFYLGTLLTIVNTSTFISIQGAYDADFFTFLFGLYYGTGLQRAAKVSKQQAARASPPPRRRSRSSRVP